MMIGFDASEIRRGAPLPVGANGLGGRIIELEAAARTTGRPALVEEQGQQGDSVEIFHNPAADGGYVVTLLDVTERGRPKRRFARRSGSSRWVG